MSQNVPGKWTWTHVKQDAARHVAEDVLSDASIAEQLGINRRTLTRWKQHPTFVARVAELRAAWAQAVADEGLANRKNRVAALNDRWQRMLQVIDERGDDPAMVDVPGGPTGLLVHQTKAVGAGKQQTLIDEYAVDTGLLRELRAHEEQAAKELGQWTDRSELTVALSEEIDKLAREFETTPEQVRADMAAMLGKKR